MEEYAHIKNIERFEHDVEVEPDPERKDLLQRLLNEERVQLERLLKSRSQLH